MAPTITQFILSFSYSPTHELAAPGPLPPALAIICESLPQALHELYLLPMDQFHKEIAARQGFSYHLSEVTITDLHTGLPAIKLLTAPEFPRDGETAVWLRMEGTYPTIIREMPPDKAADRTTLTHSNVPFLTYHQQDDMLFPAPSYQDMYYQICRQLLRSDASAQGANYEVTLSGTLHEHPIVTGDSILYPPLTEEHLYPSLPTAFHKLISYPSAYFDADVVLRKELDRHFVHAFLVDIHGHDEQPIALIYLIAPEYENRRLPSQDSGRFLELHPTLFDQLAADLIDPQHISVVNGRPVIQLNTWVEHQGYTLAPTESLKRLVHYFSTLPEASLSAFTFALEQHGYSATADHKTNSETPTHHLPEAYRRQTYTNDLLTALFNLMQLMVVRDGKYGIFNNSLENFVGNKLVDSSGYPQIMLVRENEVIFPIPGIYLAIESRHETSPAFQQLCPQQLTQGGLPRIVQDNRILYQVASYQDGRLTPNKGYHKFHLAMQAHYIDQLIEARPAMLQPQIPPLNDIPFVVALQWQITSETGVPTDITTHAYCRDVEAALSAYFHFEGPHFSGKAFHALPFALQLRSVALLENKRQGLVQVMDAWYEPGPPSLVRHAFDIAKASPDLIKVLDPYLFQRQDNTALRRQQDPFQYGKGHSP